MLKELINRVRGQVWLRVTCPYPERVLNLCSARKLAFWDLEWEGTETFTCRMSRGDHRILSRAAEKLDCTIEIVRREGAPYTLAKLRHRQALAVGIAACGTAVLIGSATPPRIPPCSRSRFFSMLSPHRTLCGNSPWLACPAV